MAHTLGVNATGSGSGNGTFALNGTTAGRGIIVGIYTRAESITSVTCSGESNLTPIGTLFAATNLFGGNDKFQLFVLDNITSSGNKTIGINVPAGDWAAFAYEFAGGDTTGWYDTGTVGTATGSGTTASVNITPSADNALIVAIAGADNSDPSASGAGYVGITVANIWNLCNGEYNLDVGAAGTKTVSMGVAGGGPWAIVAAAFNVAGGGGDPAPSITSVDGDDTITSDQTGWDVSGTAFDNATVEIRQGSTTVAQTVNSQNATTINCDTVFESTVDLKFGDATLAVINADEQEGTRAITIIPPAGELYVDLGTPNATAENRITAIPDLASGDQLHVRSAPTGLTLNADGTFYFASGNEPAAFDVRAWDAGDSTWGDWATQTVGSAQEAGDITEGAELGDAFSAVALVAVSITEPVEAADTFSGRASALASITEALEAGDTDGAAIAAAVALQAQVTSDAQYAAIAQAAAAIQAGLEAGETWAAIAAAEAGLTAGASLGAAFASQTESAQEAALTAGTAAAAQFLGAVAAFGLLSSGASAADAFGASARIGGAFTSAAQAGASFSIATANDVSLSAAAAIQSAFASVAEASGSLSAPVDMGDAYQAISVALAALSAGVMLGAVFSAASSADISIVGATASVRAIRRMTASVRSIRPTATIN